MAVSGIPQWGRAVTMQLGQVDKQNLTVHRWFANKACPGDYIYNRLGQIANEVNARLKKSGSKPGHGYTKIAGRAQATAEQMKKYIKAKNPNVAKSVIKMIPLYLSEGENEGIRGDVAFAQSCLETGNFTFSGSAVTLSQNNFCGMGVTANGMKGNSFKDPKTGIWAQIQHLKAYASKKELKNTCVDPRFQYVSRGCAKYVEYLGIKENPKGVGWASGIGYGGKILAILGNITRTTGVSGEGAGNITFKADVSYQVEVTVADLNIRVGPGTNYDKTEKYTGKGIFTIVEEKQGNGASKGWGKLASGAGWISLDIASKI